MRLCAKFSLKPGNFVLHSKYYIYTHIFRLFYSFLRTIHQIHFIPVVGALCYQNTATHKHYELIKSHHVHRIKALHNYGLYSTHRSELRFIWEFRPLKTYLTISSDELLLFSLETEGKHNDAHFSESALRFSVITNQRAPSWFEIVISSNHRAFHYVGVF